MDALGGVLGNLNEHCSLRLTLDSMEYWITWQIRKYKLADWKLATGIKDIPPAQSYVRFTSLNQIISIKVPWCCLIMLTALV